MKVRHPMQNVSSEKRVYFRQSRSISKQRQHTWIVVRLHSSPRPSGPKRTKRISQLVRSISGVSCMADWDNSAVGKGKKPPHRRIRKHGRKLKSKHSSGRQRWAFERHRTATRISLRGGLGVGDRWSDIAKCSSNELCVGHLSPPFDAGISRCCSMRRTTIRRAKGGRRSGSNTKALILEEPLVSTLQQLSSCARHYR